MNIYRMEYFSFFMVLLKQYWENWEPDKPFPLEDHMCLKDVGFLRALEDYENNILESYDLDCMNKYDEGVDDGFDDGKTEGYNEGLKEGYKNAQDDMGDILKQIKTLIETNKVYNNE